MMRDTCCVLKKTLPASPASPASPALLRALRHAFIALTMCLTSQVIELKTK